MIDSIFIDTSIILSVAIAVAFLVQLLRQPLIISYIITGIICGPLFLNRISSAQEFFHVFAEFGVILLLFLVGLGFDVKYLRKIGKVVMVTGFGQIFFTSLVGYIILALLGFSNASSFFLAVSITFSSTIIVMKLLGEKRELHTIYGRYTIGLMLLQDLIAIGIMIFLPILQNGSSILVSFLWIFLKCLGVIITVVVLSRGILPIILRNAAKSGEFLLIFSLAWCFAIAGFGEWIGISLEVGAIIAGLSLGSSVYQIEIASRIKPIRDFFIALFFIILGSEVNVANFSSAVTPSFVLVAFVLIGNPIILYLLYRGMRFTRQNSFLASLTSAHVSEFGFVFLFVAQNMKLIDENIISIFTIVALVTIFISSYLMTYNFQIYLFLRPILDFFGRDNGHNEKEREKKFEVLVFGYHRLGWKVCEALHEKGVDFAVIDCDPLAIDKLRARKIHHFFGDARDVEFLVELPLAEAQMIVSTLPEFDDQMMLVKRIKRENADAVVITSLAHTRFLEDLYEAGADYVIIPHLLGGQWIANVLKSKPWTKKTFKSLFNEQRRDLKLRYNLGKN